MKTLSDRECQRADLAHLAGTAIPVTSKSWISADWDISPALPVRGIG